VLVLVREEPVLRWRMAYSASCYAAFGAVWTSVGFLLAGPPFRLSDAIIGLFSLFGVAGALGAQFAGRLADRGWAHVAVGVFLALTALSFIAFGFGATSLVALAVGLIVFDLGVQGTHISNQTIVYALRPEARSRLNSAYMTVYFLGGATGSGLSALLYASHGWAGVCVVGAAFPTVGLALWLVDTARRRSRARPVEAAG
jgi:predicted MFS family arabinose efflux permease